jgi:phosphatidylinositol alpha-mannosyltransferase
MGMPALVSEGMTWKDLRLRALHASPVQLRGSSRRGEATELEF